MASSGAWHVRIRGFPATRPRPNLVLDSRSDINGRIDGEISRKGEPAVASPKDGSGVKSIRVGSGAAVVDPLWSTGRPCHGGGWDAVRRAWWCPCTVRSRERAL